MNAGPSRWRDLLRLALPALDRVYGRVVDMEAPAWTLGGGTAIAIRIDHRVSYDIDVFIQSGRLKDLTPPANPDAARISSTFHWPGHYLKFEHAMGEIDFLSAPLQTKPGFEPYDFEGRTIALETAEEVIVKKARFRSATFTARDVFDLAAVAAARPRLAEVLAEEVPDVLRRVWENILLRQRQGLSALSDRLNLTPFGQKVLPTVFENALAVIDRAVALHEEGRSQLPIA